MEWTLNTRYNDPTDNTKGDLYMSVEVCLGETEPGRKRSGLQTRSSQYCNATLAMEFFNDIGGDPLKPSLFELVAQEQLRDLLQPALKYVLGVSEEADVL
jgi:hypothetical protein